jgi:Lon-like protease
VLYIARVISRLTAHRGRALAVCAVPVVALLTVAAFAPLPFSVAQPGITADVLGENRNEPVITVGEADGGSGRETEGELLMTTIAATSPDTAVRLPDVVSGWFETDRAVMPRDSVYPVGDEAEEIREYNEAEMERSQNAATRAALGEMDMAPNDVDVTLRLEDVGGPSAGLLFSLGIIDKIEGDGEGGSLTGGATISGTGTITADGEVGAVGGVPLKTRAAKRDGATAFLVPRAECADARAVRPEGLRLIPVTTLSGAVDALKSLQDGGRVPGC